MNKDKNIFNTDFSSNIIKIACDDIADNKTNREVNDLLVEELSELIKAVEKLETELIKAVVKLERWDNGETTLRYNIDEIYNNLVERFEIVSEKLIVLKVEGEINGGK